MNPLEIEQFLRDQGYAEHVCRGGAEGLIRRWKEFVAEVEKGYPFGLEDYRNDLDFRAAIELLGLGDQVEEADQRLRELLVHTDVRVWESAPGDPFWDFGYPSNSPRPLLSSLQSEGLA